MAPRTGFQLPSIDYVLSSVAMTSDYHSHTPGQAASVPPLYEPLQQALSQWGITLTAPKSLCKPAPASNAIHTCQPVDSIHGLDDAMDTAIQTNVPMRRNCGGAVLDAPTTHMPLSVKYVNERQQPPDLSMILCSETVRPKSRCSGVRECPNLIAPSIGARAASMSSKESSERPASRSIATGTKKKGSQEARMLDGVVDQLASCRERLSEIDFRAVERGDGLFECSLCREAYRTKTLVTRHAVTHLENPKPFSCSVCNKRFSRCDTLHRHTKRKACKMEAPSVRAWDGAVTYSECCNRKIESTREYMTSATQSTP